MVQSLEKFLKHDSLPTLPEVAVKVLEIARRPDPDLAELASVVRLDPAIAGRLMRAANSALMGMKSPAASIDVAVARLGSTMVRTLILGFSLARFDAHRPVELRPWYRRLWKEILFQAVAAETLARRQSRSVDAADWFLAGLLQDIGRLAMLTVAGEAYLDQVLDVDDARSQRHREQEYFGFTHVDVTVGLCRKWNLGGELVDAVAAHHRLPQDVAPLEFASATSMPLGLITAGLCAEYIEAVATDLKQSREQMERLLLQVFAFRPNEVFRMLADLDASVGEFAALMAIDVGDVPSREQLLTEAEEILEQVAIEQQLQLVENSGSSRPREKNGDASQWRDPVTGLFNKRYLEEGCLRLQEETQRDGEALALIQLRINGYAEFADSAEESDCGHLVKSVATQLHRALRLSDCLVRSADDRFAIIMSDVNSDMLTLLVAELCKSLNTAFARNPDWEDLTCSAGAAIRVPGRKKVKTKKLFAAVEQALTAASRGAGYAVARIENGKVTCQSAPQPAVPVAGAI